MASDEQAGNIASPEYVFGVDAEHYRQMMEVSPEAILIHRKGTVVYINQAGMKLLGAARADEVIGLSLKTFVHPDYLPQLAERMREVYAAGMPTPLSEYKISCLDGRELHVEANGVLIAYKGQPAIQTVVRDITERKGAIESLRQSEERYRAFVEQSSEAIWRFEIEQPVSIKLSEDEQIALFYQFGYLAECNDMMAQMYGLSRAEEIVGARLRDFFPDSNPPNLVYLRNFIRSGYRLVGAETEELDRQGQRRYFTNNLTGIVEGDFISRAWGTQREVTEGKRAEEALRFQKTLLEAQTEASIDGILVVSSTGEIISYNSRFVEMWEIPAEMVASRSNEAAFQSVLHKLADPQEMQRQTAYLYEHPDETGRHELLLTDGRVFDRYTSPVRGADGTLYGRVWFFRDITERRELEERFRQSQKMEAVGQLAGGVAHDFNNLLTVINGYSDLALRNVKADETLHHQLDEIRNAGERAADLTRQLLAFSRKQLLQPKVLNLNDVVADIIKMALRLLGEDIQVVTALNPALGRVRVDPGQIEQVLMNLLVNARDAMPTGGKITISTDNVRMDEQIAKKYVSVQSGAHIRLSVSDTGTGMDAETQQHVFDPFFTTKEVGKGTGLGLSTVYGIVKQSDGYISVYSEIGHGTTFKVYLPRVEETVERGAPAVEAEIPGGTETILIVEDEEMVRTLAHVILQEFGYNVLEAPHGVAGLQLCREHEGTIQLLLTDVVMPQMSGGELAAQASLLRPEMKVLYMSGYTDNVIVHHGVLEEGTPFLEKPFAPDALARKVRDVLDG